MPEFIDTVKIHGLKEFSKDLRKLDSDLPKALRIALNEAAEVVVDEARPKVPTLTGRARKSIRPRSTRTAVRVAGGGKRVPYYPWLDFGGRVGRRRSVTRPFLKEGRYIYAAYFAKSASGEFAEVLQKALVQVAEQAGLEVTDG